MILQVHRLVQLAAINRRNGHHAEPSDISTISFLFHSRDSPKIQTNQPLNRLCNIIAFRRSRSFLSFRHFFTSTIFFLFFLYPIDSFVSSHTNCPYLFSFHPFNSSTIFAHLRELEEGVSSSSVREAITREIALANLFLFRGEGRENSGEEKRGRPISTEYYRIFERDDDSPPPSMGENAFHLVFTKVWGNFPENSEKNAVFFPSLSLSLSVSRRIRSLKGTSKLNGAFTLCRYSNAFESSSFFWYGARRERIREKAKN